MTKKEFVEALNTVPDDAQVIIYDYYTFGQLDYRFDFEKYHTDNGKPMAAIEVNYEGRE